MHFDEIIEQVNQGITQFSLPDTWAQGRTLFGGLVAGILYQALRAKMPNNKPLRSLNTHFIGPIVPDQAFDIQVEILREGKNMTFAEARAVQNGRIASSIMAVFGTDRNSKIKVTDHAKHQMEIPKKPKFIPQVPGVTPRFLRHIDLSIESGGMPFTKSKSSHYHGWMRFKQAPKQVTDAHLITLIDAWPPTVLQMVFGPKPASSVSWNLEFIHPHSEFKPDDWFAYQAETRQADGGYAHTEANIWDQQGELVAISRQLVAIFD